MVTRFLKIHIILYVELKLYVHLIYLVCYINSKNRDVSSTPTSTRYLQREHTSSKTNGYTRSAFRSRIPSETSKSVQQTARPPPSERVPPTKSTKTLPTTMSLTTPWARKFIMSRPKDALLPIPREFLSDGFNLVRVAPIVDRTVANTVAAERDEAQAQEKLLSPDCELPLL